jgi:Mg2+/citrate symporter
VGEDLQGHPAGRDKAGFQHVEGSSLGLLVLLDGQLLLDCLAFVLSKLGLSFSTDLSMVSTVTVPLAVILYRLLLWFLALVVTTGAIARTLGTDRVTFGIEIIAGRTLDFLDSLGNALLLFLLTLGFRLKDFHRYSFGYTMGINYGV